MILQLAGLRRHKTLIFCFAFHLHATGSPVNRMPDFQQNCFPVFAPLMIPESQFFNVLAVEELPSRFVLLHLLRQAVVKSVHFNGEPRHRTVEIQDVTSQGMLPTKLESGKSAGAQGPP
jgi:hypothetical protein